MQNKAIPWIMDLYLAKITQSTHVSEIWVNIGQIARFGKVETILRGGEIW